jgi:hypothetical protein
MRYVPLALTVVGLALGGCTCGAPVGEPPPPPQPAAVYGIALEVDRDTASVGDDVELAWTLDGSGARAALIIRAITPRGDVYFLDGDDAWSSAPAGRLAADGAVSLPLPSDEGGIFHFRVTAGAQAYPESPPMAVATASVFQADGPAVFVELSRTLGDLSDVVRAHARVHPGGAPLDGELYATLTQPDGGQLSLPWSSEVLQPLASGELSGARHVLLNRTLDQAGEHLLRVDLVDDEGATVAFHERRFAVCTGTRELGGVVRDDAGAPLAGASVRALEVGGAGSRVAETDADGRYSLEVTSGTWSVSALVFDDGVAHSGTGGVVRVTCEAGALALDVDTERNELSVGGASATSAWRWPSLDVGARIARLLSFSPARAEDADDGLPKPILFVEPDGSRLSPTGEATTWTLAGATVTAIFTGADGEVETLGYGDVLASVNLAAQQQQLGVEENHVDLEELAGMMGTEFRAKLVLDEDSERKYAWLELYRQPESGQRQHLAYKAASGGDWLAVVTDIERFANEIGPSLVEKMREVQARPIVPTLSAEAESVATGESPSAEATLTDKNGEVAEDQEVVVRHVTPEGDVEQRAATTGALGSAAASVSASSSAGVGRLSAQYTRGGQTWHSRRETTYRVSGDTSIVITSPSMLLDHGDGDTFTVVVNDAAGDPIPEATVQVGAVRGTTSESELTTGSDGSASATFTAGDEGGTGGVTASYTDGEGAVHTSELSFLLGAPIRLQLIAAPSVVQPGGVASVTARLDAGFEDHSGAEVALTVSGGGELSATTGETNAAGEFTAIYTAPDEGEGTATLTFTVRIWGLPHSVSTTVRYGAQELVVEGDVHLATQAEVNAFAGTTRVNGSLTIGTEYWATEPETTDIVSLLPLDGLTTVTGDLTIWRTQLASLSGLEDLEEVQILQIAHGPLASLAALAGISDIHAIELRELPQLVTLAGLEGHTHLGHLGLFALGTPLDISALSSLTEVGMDVSQFAGGEFDPEWERGNVDLWDLDLTSFTGLHNLERTWGGLLLVRVQAGSGALTSLRVVAEVGGTTGAFGATDVKVGSNEVLNIAPALERVAEGGVAVQRDSSAGSARYLFPALATATRVAATTNNDQVIDSVRFPALTSLSNGVWFSGATMSEVDLTELETVGTIRVIYSEPTFGVAALNGIGKEGATVGRVTVHNNPGFTDTDAYNWLSRFASTGDVEIAFNGP